MTTRFSTIPFGETCDKHPPMKFRGQDKRAHIYGPTRPLSEQEKRILQPSEEWFRQAPSPAQRQPGASKGTAAPPRRPYACEGDSEPPHALRSVARGAQAAASNAEATNHRRQHADPTVPSPSLPSPPTTSSGGGKPSTTEREGGGGSSSTATAEAPPRKAPPERPQSRIHSALPSSMDAQPPRVVDRVVAKIVAPPPKPALAAGSAALSAYDVHLRMMEIERQVDDAVAAMKRYVGTKTDNGAPAQQSRFLQTLLKKFVPVCASTVTNQQPTEMTPEMFGSAIAAGFNGLVLSPDVRDAVFDRFDANEDGSLTFREFADGMLDVATGGRPCGCSSAKARELVNEIRAAALRRNRSDDAVSAVTRSFRTMNRSKDGGLCKEELFNGLQRAKVQCTMQQCAAVVAAFDRTGTGRLSLKEFLHALHGPLPRRRRVLIRTAFNILDRDGSGVVTLDEIKQCYHAEDHPAVQSGEQTVEEVLLKFMQVWDLSGDGEITWREFLTYYRDVSAAIANDDYFELMMRNAWRISGGEGQAANTANRRVLVTYGDGTQTVEEIKNDLGIRATDIDKMKANLEKQGLTDIIRLELYN